MINKGVGDKRAKQSKQVVIYCCKYKHALEICFVDMY
jgi:hypothetical protein